MAAPGMTVGSLRRDPWAGWVVLALAALAAFVVLALMLLALPAFSAADAAISAGIRGVRTPWLTPIAEALTFVGSARLVMPVALLLVVWMAARRNWAGVIYIAMTVAVGWALGNYLVKNLIRRERPVGVNIVPLPHDYSMPSTHSLAAFLLLATLCVLVMLNLPTGRHVKRWIATGSAVLIVAIGLSRVYLGVHWFGDVVGAFLLGGAWWSFTTATYFGSVTEEKRATPRIAP